MAATLATLLACPPADALVALNDGRDRIYVSGTVSASHDSNIRASSDSAGDMIYSTAITAEYARRAGWIGVDASIGLESAEFGKMKEENYQNPSLRAEFDKHSGRTTGTLNLSAARESRADAAVNVRSTSWNYGSDLKMRYPLAGAYTLTGGFGYSAREYVGNEALASLYTFSTFVDALRAVSGERELTAGYRYRYNETSFDTSSIDQAITAGVSGKLIRGIKGSLRAGYQVRTLQGGPAGDGTFGSWTASLAMSRPLNKKATLGAQLSKDFSITANDSSVDATVVSLNAQYAFSSHLVATASTSWSHSRFLGERGRVLLDAGPPPLLGPARVDTYANWDAGLQYSMNEHLKITLNYVWFRNWSSYAYADFVRNTWTASVSSRW